MCYYLIEEIVSLISKEMSNVYLKVTVEKKLTFTKRRISED